DAPAVLAAAAASAQALVAEMGARLGADVVRSALSAALHVPGVYRVDLVQPGVDIDVPAQGWAHCTALDVSLAGVSHG
nr:phage tail protein [Rhodoferax sp.]